MKKNAPKRNIGSKNNVNPIINESVIKRIPINFINEKINVGIIKYKANLGKKN